MTIAPPERILGELENKSIISVQQFNRADVDTVMREADGMAKMVQEEGRSDLLDDMVFANLFYEPSTRTFLSFEAAAKRLGAATIATQGVEFSSITKGETLEDTIRTVERYADTITIRHKEVGSAAIAAEVSRVPVINGGDGTGEHPTQALLDFFTIRHRLDSTEDLTVTMVGDLKHGRTVHSLAKLLALHNARINYVAPEQLAMPEEVTEELKDLYQADQGVVADLREAVAESDVVYMTRTQQERFESEDEYERVNGAYSITPEIMRLAKQDMILMHPLPRLKEISTKVDSDPRAAYFDQVENGMFIRMALLALVNGRSIQDI